MESCDAAPRLGRPSTVTHDENVNKIHDLVIADRKQTVRKIAQYIEVSYGIVQ